MTPWKVVERSGRQLLVSLLGVLMGVRRRPVVLPDAPKILVIRLDERLGNLLLLTPFLQSLRLRFPAAQIDLLANARGAGVLAGHPSLSAFLPFRKRALVAADGPLAAPWRLRRRGYDLCIDAANPTDPSATQAILTRLSGARHTVGSDRPGFGRLYSAAAALPPPRRACHEIDLRLRLLDCLPGTAVTRALSLGPQPAPGAAVTAFLTTTTRPFGIVNIGARLREKHLSVEDYILVAALLEGLGLVPVLTYGPGEAHLAQAVAAARPAFRVAPPTGVAELALLMQRAVAVVSCDTGPMHLAVAVGTPTCGIFVSTDPLRFGYDAAPNMAIDARTGPRQDWLQMVYVWAVRLQVPRIVRAHGAPPQAL